MSGPGVNRSGEGLSMRRGNGCVDWELIAIGLVLVAVSLAAAVLFSTGSPSIAAALAWGVALADRIITRNDP